MKKLFPLIIAALLVISCSDSNEPDEIQNTTLLNISVKVKDSVNPPDGGVYIWDASSNTFPEELTFYGGLGIGKIKDINGINVDAIASMKLSKNRNSNGSYLDNSYAIFNVDKILFYDKNSTSGKLLVYVFISSDRSQYSNYTYKTIEWNRSKELKIEKIFIKEQLNSLIPMFEEW